VFDLTVERHTTELTDRVIIEVAADGFLYNMVRNIVGTLVAVGKAKEPVDWPARVLELRDRRAAGMTAPAQGLFLVGVNYPEILDFGLPILDSKSADEELPLE
jgi:tRNA pseudouridine38-40 synthase